MMDGNNGINMLELSIDCMKILCICVWICFFICWIFFNENKSDEQREYICYIILDYTIEMLYIPLDGKNKYSANK